MKIIYFLFALVTLDALALEAVVTVLEAPVFREQNLNSQVVQYIRKGDVVNIHPAVANTKSFDQMAPNAEKYESLKQEITNQADWKDPLFNKTDVDIININDQFIPIIDRMGKTSYVLSEHIYVYFKDSREFTQTSKKKDPTDYRLEEPLPPKYPLFTKSGYRGSLLFGFSQPYNESYPYQDAIKTKSYTNPMGINFGYLRQVSYDVQDRFYFGGNFNFKTFENTYSFKNARLSNERYVQFGIGPLIAYDAYKGTKDRINLSLSINFNPFSQLNISQYDSSNKESRLYRTYNFSSRLGLQYHRKNIVDMLDFVVGTSMDFESPATYQAQDGGGQSDWWQNLGADKFTTRAYFTLTGYLGLQAAY